MEASSSRAVTSEPIAAAPAKPEGKSRRHSRRHGLRKPVRLTRALRLGICGVLAAILTFVIIHYSLRHGRLIVVPSYDDVGYFSDGAMHLQALYDHGVRGLWDAYVLTPPHSPVQTVLAMSAFAAFGFHDWAPYVLNSLLVFILLIAAERLIKGTYLWQKLICFALLLTIPFSAMAIHEFRPDFACAIFTCVGAFMLLSGPFVQGSRKRLVVAGVWLGLAMLAKPPVFPQTFVLGFGAISMVTLIDWIMARRLSFNATLRAGLCVWLPFILIPLPHYLFDRKTIISYIRMVMFSKFKESYQTHIPRSQHFLYYLTGPGGQLMLGWHFWLLAALLFLGGIALLFLGSKRDRLSALAMLMLTFAAYSIATINLVKQEYFGLTFDVALAFTVLYIIGRLLVAERLRRRHLYHIVSIGLCAATTVGIWNWQWPLRYGNVNAGWQEQRRQIVLGVFNTIVAHCTFHGDDTAPLPDSSIDPNDKVTSETPVVLFCAIGDVNPSTIEWLGWQNQTPMQGIYLDNTNDPEDFIKAFRKADFVFCAQSGTKLMADFMVASRLQDTLVDAAKSDPELEEVGRWSFMLSKDRHLYLFMRRNFGGFVPVNNMSAMEGPFPEYGRREVRWGYGPSTTLQVPAREAGTYDLNWIARSDYQQEVVTIKVDGQEVRNEPVLGSFTEFSEAHIPLQLSKGDHTVEFQYTRWHDEEPRHMAVLFRRLMFAPVQQAPSK